MGAATLLDIEATQSEVDESEDTSDVDWDNDDFYQRVHWNQDDPARVPNLPPSFDHQKAINRFDALFGSEENHWSLQPQPTYDRWVPATPMQYHYPLPRYEHKELYRDPHLVSDRNENRARKVDYSSLRTGSAQEDNRVNMSSMPILSCRATSTVMTPTTADGKGFLSSIDNYRKLREQRYSWLRQVNVPQG